MALDKSIKSVLVIGSGPIVIGQACEFDYSGTQACRVLRSEGIRVVLINSNPATIMTDPEFADAIEKVVVDRGELTLHVKREKLVEVAKVLRDKLLFEMCMGVNGVHYPNETGRELHAVYPLLSITHNRRIRIEVTCPDSDPHIPSLVNVWAGNNWHERETFDMFGIIFDGHPALTRILMPDDWQGHPQRKDYALNGINVEYKGASQPAPDNRRAYK